MLARIGRVTSGREWSVRLEKQARHHILAKALSIDSNATTAPHTHTKNRKKKSILLLLRTLYRTVNVTEYNAGP